MSPTKLHRLPATASAIASAAAPFRLRRAVSAVLAITLGACTIGPNYSQPKMAVPATFKEAPAGWKTAQPSDRDARGNWWEIFNDPVLNDLVAKANVSNQSIASYEAAYRQAQALVAQARANYLPTVTGSGSATRSGSGRGTSSNGSNAFATTGGSTVSNSYSTALDASWEPDLWGKFRRGVASERDSQQSAEANLANVRLSVQGTLAQDYFQLRTLDSTQALYDRTVAAYQRFLQLTQNQYNAGTAGRADVISALTQLQSAQAAAVDNGINRATYEHAIAVLLGEPASTFSLPASPLSASPPTVPLSLPSALLERRPDVASAERLAAAANEQIGIAQTAYFPTLSLSASGGFSSSSFSNWLTAPARVWSLGPQLAATLFDGGLRHAQVEAARAVYDQQVATYKAAVLTAFQDVEDNLASLRILASEEGVQQQALDSAQQSLQIITNGYKAGTNTYLEVLSAQATSFNAERTLLDIQGRQMVSAAGLIKALGGGWGGLGSPVVSTVTDSTRQAVADSNSVAAPAGQVAPRLVN